MRKTVLRRSCKTTDKIHTAYVRSQHSPDVQSDGTTLKHNAGNPPPDMTPMPDLGFYRAYSNAFVSLSVSMLQGTMHVETEPTLSASHSHVGLEPIYINLVHFT